MRSSLDTPASSRRQGSSVLGVRLSCSSGLTMVKFVRFANGAQVTLQRLGPDVKGYVIDALLSPLWAPEMAEVL